MQTILKTLNMIVKTIKKGFKLHLKDVDNPVACYYFSLSFQRLLFNKQKYIMKIFLQYLQGHKIIVVHFYESSLGCSEADELAPRGNSLNLGFKKYEVKRLTSFTWILLKHWSRFVALLVIRDIYTIAFGLQVNSSPLSIKDTVKLNLTSHNLVH